MLNYAAIKNNGLSQSIELPEGFRLEGDQVLIKRIGDALVLIPQPTVATIEDPWKIMADAISQFTPDYMSDRIQPNAQSREAAFD